MSSVDYIIKFLQKIQQDQIRSVVVKQEMQDAFNEYTQEVHQDLVWTGSCASWCKCRTQAYAKLRNKVADKDERKC